MKYLIKLLRISFHCGFIVKCFIGPEAGRHVDSYVCLADSFDK